MHGIFPLRLDHDESLVWLCHSGGENVFGYLDMYLFLFHALH